MIKSYDLDFWQKRRPHTSRLSLNVSTHQDISASYISQPLQVWTLQKRLRFHHTPTSLSVTAPWLFCLRVLWWMSGGAALQRSRCVAACKVLSCQLICFFKVTTYHITINQLLQWTWGSSDQAGGFGGARGVFQHRHPQWSTPEIHSSVSGFNHPVSLASAVAIF